MQCFHCGSLNLSRKVREGWRDALNLWLLCRWPWICNECRKVSHLPARTDRQRLPKPRPPAPVVPVRSVDGLIHPVITARKLPQRPSTAAVMIEAPSEQQLTSILLALSHAVQREQVRPQRQPEQDKVPQRSP